MMRSLKIFLILLITASLVGVVGHSPLLMASSSISHSTHFISNKGPQLPQNETGCYVCHAAGNQQCAASPMFADDKSLVETNVCNVCHSPGGALDGVNDPVIGAKANWDSGVYEAEGKALKAEKDKWCGTCHDDLPANSESDGSGTDAPRVLGDSANYGYYVTGHGANRAVQCLDCHDARLNHIDHEPRTYELDEATGKAVNPYNYSYRLKGIRGEQPLVIPGKSSGNPIDRSHYFALCLECHKGNEVIGTNDQDMTYTNLWNDESDDQGRTYGDGTVRNSHNYHLAIGHLWDSDWDSNSTNDSVNNCVTCHNVHGSPSGPMIRHGELRQATPALNFQYLDSSYQPNADTPLKDSTGGRTIYPNGTCFACHGTISYYRTPNLAPKVVYAKATPEGVILEGSSENVLLTCTVLDHDDNLSAVTIDLSAIQGSSAQAMYDDGTNGDVEAGDSIYSYQTEVPVATGSAVKSLPIMATDLDLQSNQDEILLRVLELNSGIISWEVGVSHELTLESDHGISGSLTISNGDTLSSRGDLTVGSALLVQDGGALVLLGDTYDINPAAGGSATTPYGSSSTISATHITIDSGGSINADGQGFSAVRGPGNGSAISFCGSGAGYGSNGGNSTSGAPGGSAYGNPAAPTALGSGGGDSVNGGAGGGAIALSATGTISVNGTLSANGDNGWTGGGRNGGGGSGGSIWISSGTLTGSGTISATGGNGGTNGGGGSGGRIDISHVTNDFTGTLTSVGGETAFERGLPGSILFPDGFWDDLTLTQDITLLGDDVTTSGTLTIDAGATLTMSGELIVGTTLTVNSGGSLVVKGDTLDINGGTPEDPYGSGSTIYATDIVIAAGGSINADGQGFRGSQGPGRGLNRAGAGYGGRGGNSISADGGSIYGSADSPTALGSGGGANAGLYYRGGPGGGAIKIVTAGTVLVDGTLSANGADGTYSGGADGGGGSGGSIWIASGTIAGSGTISVDGGIGVRLQYVGAGGGGRIDVSDTVYDFTGAITAAGGEGVFQRGMPGSILFPGGFWTDLTLVHDITLGNDVSVTESLTIDDGATLKTSGDVTVETALSVNSGGALIAVGDLHDINESAGGTEEDPYGNRPLVSATDITVASGGSINADGQGFNGIQGPGRGLERAGGGYGGRGGNSTSDPGGSTYGSSDSPTALGSGGGANAGLYYRGGSGGGAIELNVTGTITIDGTLSASGNDGIYSGGGDGGGGSGGSIWISSGTLTGSGIICANGGIGFRQQYVGGGGGGRIDVSDTIYDFTGAIVAAGGEDVFQRGMPGSVLFPGGFWTDLTLVHDITLGNDVSVIGSLTIDDGATLKTSGDVTVETALSVNSGGALIAVGDLHDVNAAAWGTEEDPYGSGSTITATDITIASGGSINANGRGFNGSQGPGGGLNKGGGGYGGSGGGSGGGSTYGAEMGPTALGSGGGVFNNVYYRGGSGGGALELNVTGTITIDGTLSADGSNGNYYGGADSGGGSGGSVWITSGTLSGSGVISSHGGNGDRETIAFGGGGGRIDVSGTTDDFSGTKSVYGGTGFADGEDGTIIE